MINSFLEHITIGFMVLISASSLFIVILIVLERDLMKAVIYSAIQSIMYVLLYYLLMAPAVCLVYIPIALGLQPAILFFLIKKTERFERG